MDFEYIFQSTIKLWNTIDTIIIVTILLVSIVLIYDFFGKIRKFFIVVTIILAFIPLYSKYSNYKDNKRVFMSFKNKSYKQVEGKIRNFHAMPKAGHTSERFDVNGTHFEIYYTGNYPKSKTLFYSLTKNRNGPIQNNGQNVKIYYIEDDLSKLCVPFTSRCIIFNESQKNKIIKLWVY